jgi:histidyl-tRNA synthetase
MDRLPGFRDFYPDPLPQADLWSAAHRQSLFSHWRESARRYQFLEYDGPPLEPLELYTLKSGEEIVGQLYHFSDKGGRSVALRPEMTPTLARMAAAHLRHYKKPLKWFAIPQLFRYERQQKGRLREHFQFNADILGEADPSADAELIALLIDSLRSLGLGEEDFVVRLSSRSVWQAFFTRHCRPEASAYEFFQVVDKLEREDPAQSEAKLQQLGTSRADLEQFIQDAQPNPELRLILENLDARGMSSFVKLDYRVIRGLAYYTGPVFEAFDRGGKFRAIAGGGRYDNLVNVITGGKVTLPALGFGMGDVVLTELLRSRALLQRPVSGPEVFCLIDQESDRATVLGLVQRLRNAGLGTDYSLTPAATDRQFKRALEVGARLTTRIDHTDPNGPRVVIRDLRSRQEEALALPEAAAGISRIIRDARASS